MTFPELLVSAATTACLGGAILSVMRPVESTVRVEQDTLDMEQRLRFAVDTLTRELRAARQVLPHRVGMIAPDPPGSVFPDRATMVLIDSATGTSSTRTYYLRRDTRQLMVYDGESTDLPVLDHISEVRFEYPGSLPGALVRVTIVAEPTWLELQRRHASRTMAFDVAPRALVVAP